MVPSMEASHVKVILLLNKMTAICKYKTGDLNAIIRIFKKHWHCICELGLYQCTKGDSVPNSGIVVMC